MYKIEDIKEIHLEITSNCQARCPMCARRPYAANLNPNIVLDEISLDKFKQWFSIDFIKRLTRLFMCGNLGDPIIASNTLEIFKFLREVNPDILLSMNTNGSARDLSWWKELASLNVRVLFGIDGLVDTHSLYRISTDWNKIIQNAKVFIEAGGYAEWHMLVFKHNEHQVEDCKQLSNELGFKEFITKHTARFSKEDFVVQDENGNILYKLYPTDVSKTITTEIKHSKDQQETHISCKAKSQKQIYISSTGIVSPCCWLDLSWTNLKNNNRIDYMDQIKTFPNLNTISLEEIFNSGYFDRIEKTWNLNPLLECVKQCGRFDKLMSQFK